MQTKYSIGADVMNTSELLFMQRENEIFSGKNWQRILPWKILVG